MKVLSIMTERPYEVRIGSDLLETAGTRIGTILAPKKALIVADYTVNRLYGTSLHISLEQAGIETFSFLFDPGEAAKTWNMAGNLIRCLAEKEFDRTDVVVTLGGGVAGDLGGFASSVYLRGIPFVQIPTSLLAAVDASVGGKTAVDLPSGKNLVGSFHQPSLVICDTSVFKTLPESCWHQGLAEVLKCGILTDRNLMDLIRWQGKDNSSEEMVYRALAVKKVFIEADPMDQGMRRLLNLGHTPAHAIERLSGFQIPHGQAVAMGLAIMSGAAYKTGRMNEEDYGIIRDSIQNLSLPLEIPYTAQELQEAAFMDKKRNGHRIDLVIPYGIGDCRLVKIDLDELLVLFRLGLEELHEYLH